MTYVSPNLNDCRNNKARERLAEDADRRNNRRLKAVRVD